MGGSPIWLRTGVFDNQLIMPRFALSELQAIADSSDKLRRTRGRRGLDVLNRMRADDNVDLMIFDRELPELAGQTVDLKLVLLAKHLEGKVVTGDYNLNKVAKLHNVPVINLNEISNSLRPAYLPDETFRLKVIKAGRGSRAGDRVFGRRHDGGHRRRPKPHRPGLGSSSHQHAANQCRQNDLHQVRRFVGRRAVASGTPGAEQMTENPALPEDSRRKILA